MFRKGYQKIDDALMSGANKAVRAWNWTTGRTKAELANLCHSACSVSLISAAVVLPLPIPIDFILGGIIAIPLLAATHFIQGINKKMESDEQKAQESGCLDYNVESFKSRARLGGNFLLGFSIPLGAYGAMEISRGDYETGAGLALMSAGFASAGAAEYVMRTDNLPPRKDCIRRGIKYAQDGLAHLVERMRPAPQLAPVSAHTQYSQLEGRI